MQSELERPIVWCNNDNSTWHLNPRKNVSFKLISGLRNPVRFRARHTNAISFLFCFIFLISSFFRWFSCFIFLISSSFDFLVARFILADSELLPDWDYWTFPESHFVNRNFVHWPLETVKVEDTTTKDQCEIFEDVSYFLLNSPLTSSDLFFSLCMQLTIRCIGFSFIYYT